MSKYAFVIARISETNLVEFEIFADDHALPGSVTSTQVRRAKEAPGELRTRTLNDGRSWLGWMPVNGA